MFLEFTFKARVNKLLLLFIISLDEKQLIVLIWGVFTPGHWTV